MFKKYLTLFSIVIFISCAGSKKVVTEKKEKITTVTEFTERKLDTSIFIPGEKVSIHIPIEKAQIKSYVSPKVYTQKKGRASVTVKIDSTGIEATSNCDSIAKRLNYYEKVFKEFQTQSIDIKNKVTEKKGFSFFELLLYITAVAIVSFVAGYLLKTFKKF